LDALTYAPTLAEEDKTRMPTLSKHVLVLLLIMTTLSLNRSASPQDRALSWPPEARKSPKVDIVHGDKRVDDYYWLREKSNPEVTAYLEAENAYTDAFMKPTEAFQQALYKEMLGRIQETDLSVPYRKGEHFYYARTAEGKQYPIYCRKQGSLETNEEVILDLNQLAAGKEFLGLDAFAVSDDGNLLAYSTDTTGFRVYTLFIKDLRTGQLLADRAENVGDVAWTADNQTLFYTTKDAAKRSYRLWRHRLGASQDDLLYEEKDEMFSVSVGRSRSRAYLFMTSASLTTSEVRYLAAAQPTGEWRLIEPRQAGHEYYLDHHGERFYIRTNSTGRNFALMSAPVSDPRRANWKEVIPHRSEVMLVDMFFFRDFYVLRERENGLPQLRITGLRSGKWERVPFPEPAYNVVDDENPEFDAIGFRYTYQSLVTPKSVFKYDFAKRESRLLKETPVLGRFDRNNYESERIYVTASDGARIPVSLVYRKGWKRDGSHPLYLYGYGAYGISSPVNFNSSRVSLLDRGFAYAIAHIRGGGEMGKPWHDQGRMMNKKNTFTDFIAVADHMVKEKYTSPDSLIIEGGSAGGLLMGAVTNMRPDLFKAVVSKVPFVDVINSMLDDSLPLTVGEFEEWGNPDKRDEYEYMKTYCPYTNLAAKGYPSLLVRTSFNDSQVMYWEPAKYVARMRALKTDDNPLLFKTVLVAGHGGRSGRYDYLHDVAFDYAFMLGQVGITK
ncbi:MAG: S9 family peptidase, partial [Terriglobales bacterium]